MSVRFDEIELLREPDLPSPESLASKLPVVMGPRRIGEFSRSSPVIVHDASGPRAASRFNRALAFLTDLSLFIALGLALTPLVPYRTEWRLLIDQEWATVFGLGGFLLLLSYYYFVTSWLIWGKTVGGAIFDVKVVAADGEVITGRALTRRWVGMMLSILLCGSGFLLALLPSGRSLSDRFSHTRAIIA